MRASSIELQKTTNLSVSNKLKQQENELIKRLTALLTAALIFSLLNACVRPGIVPPEDGIFREFISNAAAGNTKAAAAMLNGKGRFDTNELAGFLQQGDTYELMPLLVEFEIRSNYSVRKVEYQLAISNEKGMVKHGIINSYIGKKEEGIRIFELKFDPAPEDELVKEKDLSLNELKPMNFLMLGLSISVFMFIILTLVRVMNSKIRMKPSWVILVILGIFSISFNWNTGELLELKFAVLLFGVGISQKISQSSPWIISVGFPVGAFVFHLMRKSLIKDAISFEERERKAKETQEEIDENIRSQKQQKIDVSETNEDMEKRD